jgi:predicted DNA-binding transcriptional regulator AlpA
MKDGSAFAGLAVIKRGLSRDEAAYVVGVGTTLFDKMVEDGRMPRPARVNGRVLWDRVQLDRALDRLFDSSDDTVVGDPYAEVQT